MLYPHQVCCTTLQVSSVHVDRGHRAVLKIKKGGCLSMEKGTVSHCCDGHPDAQDCNGLVTDLSLGTYVVGYIKVVQIVNKWIESVHM